MSGFDDLRQHHAENVITTTERFGRHVIVKFPGGKSREIEATCSLKTVIEDEGDSGVKKSIDRLTVTVQRDEVNGIANPTPGYTLIRDQQVDHSRRPFEFDGEIVEESPYWWVLVFTRPTLRREGR